MACEVLDKDLEGYVHRLHHDLESVLYMCVWHVFGFSLDVIPDESHIINRWRAGSWSSMLESKGYFISDSTYGNMILNSVSDETHKDNCKRLRRAFDSAARENIDVLAAHELKRDSIDLDKRVAWDKAKPAPGRYARYATFPSIMKQFGEEVMVCTEYWCTCK